MPKPKRQSGSSSGGSEAENRVGSAAHGPPASKIDRKWVPYFRKLVELRDYVLDQQHDLAAKAREIQPHYLQREAGDVASEDFERDLDLGKMSADQAMLNEIEEALDRIENGTYGICQMTGKAIPLERLKAVPWTRFTVESEKEIERRGGGIRTSLAPAERIQRPLGRHATAKPEEDVAEEPEESPDE